MNAEMNWKRDMLFECDNRGLRTLTDATPVHGGKGEAPTPKELVLNAMMGCTGMDVVAILNKMRQPFESLRLTIDTTMTGVHPVHFKTALITFFVTGLVQPEKLSKAVHSSLTKYCGVNYMISRSCEISYKIILNGTDIAAGKANFTPT